MIIVAGISGLVFGLLRGGRWRSILNKRFRLLPLLFISLICSIALASPALSDFLARQAAESLLRSSLAAIQVITFSIFFLANRFKPGIVLVLAGGLTNGLVILLNQGRMPIGRAVLRFGEQAVSQIESAPHYFLASGGEPLLLFGDLFPFWTFGWYMVSFGDFLIAGGLFLLSAYLSKPVLRKKNKAAQHSPV